MRGTQPVGMKYKGEMRLQTSETQCDRQGLAFDLGKKAVQSNTEGKHS